MNPPVFNRNLPLKMALDASTLEKLNEIKAQYERLSSVESPEADAEKEKIAELADKYSTYREIKVMMVKIKTMWKVETSESRRAKQLRSFVQLYQGRLELEELLKEKLGLSFNKSPASMDAYAEVERLNAEIQALEAKLTNTQIVLPEGASTRDQRFAK